jgi:hypothetical protein
VFSISLRRRRSWSLTRCYVEEPDRLPEGLHHSTMPC